MSRKPPCNRDGVPCPRRCPGCQDHCKQMIEFQSDVRLDNERRRQQMKVDSFLECQGMRWKKRPDSRIKSRRNET